MVVVAEAAPATAATTPWAESGTEGAGHLPDEPAAAPATEAGALRTDAWALQYELVLAAFHHGRRERAYASAQRWGTFATLLASSGAAAAFGGHGTWLGVALAFVAAVISAASLAFDISARARLHNELRRRVLDLAAKLHEDDGAASRAAIRATIIRIAADEPSAPRACLDVARRDADLSLGCVSPSVPPLSAWTRMRACLPW